MKVNVAVISPKVCNVRYHSLRVETPNGVIARGVHMRTYDERSDPRCLCARSRDRGRDEISSGVRVPWMMQSSMQERYKELRVSPRILCSTGSCPLLHCLRETKHGCQLPPPDLSLLARPLHPERPDGPENIAISHHQSVEVERNSVERRMDRYTRQAIRARTGFSSLPGYSSSLLASLCTSHHGSQKQGTMPLMSELTPVVRYHREP